MKGTLLGSNEPQSVPVTGASFKAGVREAAPTKGLSFEEQLAVEEFLASIEDDALIVFSFVVAGVEFPPHIETKALEIQARFKKSNEEETA